MKEIYGEEGCRMLIGKEKQGIVTFLTIQIWLLSTVDRNDSFDVFNQIINE